MRKAGKGAGIALCAAVLTTGCFTEVSSLHPLVDDEAAVAVPAIVGCWADEEGGSTVLSFRHLDGAEYEMSVVEDGKGPGAALRVRFGRLGDDLYWDLTAPASEDEGLWGEHRLPVHSFARVRLEDDRFELAFLDPDWLEKAGDEGRLEVSSAEVGHRLLLTASTAELRGLVLEHGGEEGFLTPVAVFRRPAE